MAHRYLLHKNDVDSFKAYLTTQGVKWRDMQNVGDGWQILQFQNPHNKEWVGIFNRKEVIEHVTVQDRGVFMVRKFLEWKKDTESKARQAIAAAKRAVPPTAPATTQYSTDFRAAKGGFVAERSLFGTYRVWTDYYPYGVGWLEQDLQIMVHDDYGNLVRAPFVHAHGMRDLWIEKLSHAVDTATNKYSRDVL